MQRMTKQTDQTFSGKRVSIDLEVTFGAVGAPTLVTSGTPIKSRGVASIARTSAGLYALTLQDRYVRFTNMFATWQNATGLPIAGRIGLLGAPANGTAPTGMVVTFNTLQGNGASPDVPVATDPASGDKMYLTVILEDSTS
jgi:hypothetical protein